MPKKGEGERLTCRGEMLNITAFYPAFGPET